MSKDFENPPKPSPAFSSGQPENSVKKTGATLIVALSIIGVIGLCCCIAIPLLLLEVRNTARETQSKNNLKMIGIAMHNHLDVHKYFPMPNSSKGTSLPGKGNHSWRVQLLPFLELRSMYEQIDWDSDWDSPQNKPITESKISWFISPFDKEPGNITSYVAIVDQGTALHPTRRKSLTFIRDGASETILVIEYIGSGIRWAEPRDVTINQAIEIIQSAKSGKTNALMCDGSVRSIPSDLPKSTLRAMMTASSGETITP